MKLLSGRAQRRSRRSVAELDNDSRDRLRRLLDNARLSVLPTSDVVGKIEARLTPGAAGLVVAAHRGLGVDQTVAVAEVLASRGYAVTPQIDASEIRNGRHFDEVLRRLSSRLMSRIVLVEPQTGNPEATERLLEELADGPIDVGIEGFPSGRPGVDAAEENELLLDRARAASFVSTVSTAEPGRLVVWLTEMRVRGLDLPVEVGVPGVVPAAILRRELPASTDAQAVREGSTYDPTAFVVDVAADHAGDRLAIAGLRLDTCNEVEASEDWRHRTYDLSLAVRSG